MKQMHLRYYLNLRESRRQERSQSRSHLIHNTLRAQIRRVHAQSNHIIVVLCCDPDLRDAERGGVLYRSKACLAYLVEVEVETTQGVSSGGLVTTVDSK